LSATDDIRTLERVRGILEPFPGAVRSSATQSRGTRNTRTPG